MGEYEDTQETETVFGLLWKIYWKLDQVFQSASDGKLLLQSSLANEGISISTTTPQTFKVINDSLTLLCTNYKAKIGELDEELLKANSSGLIAVNTRGWSSLYDGNYHGISVSVDTEAYDVKFGTSADTCTLKESPTYVDPGNYTVYYTVTGKSNNKVLCGNECVNITRMPGSLTLSSTNVSVYTGKTVSVVGTNKSGGNITATCSDTSVATIMQSGNTFTITGVAPGNCTINFIGAAAGAYYGGTATLNVSVSIGQRLYPNCEYTWTDTNCHEFIFIWTGETESDSYLQVNYSINLDSFSSNMSAFNLSQVNGNSTTLRWQASRPPYDYSYPYSFSWHIGRNWSGESNMICYVR